jgi:Arc/MetJ-type ribon-helix-helix transcriptional regulator
VVVANLVRSGRKQPQRFRRGSFRLPPYLARVDLKSANAGIPNMATIQLQLPDETQASLETRARECAFADVTDYVRNLIRSDLEREEGWEMTSELAAALAEGDASGDEGRSIADIIADGRKRWSA